MQIRASWINSKLYSQLLARFQFFLEIFGVNYFIDASRKQFLDFLFVGNGFHRVICNKYIKNPVNSQVDNGIDKISKESRKNTGNQRADLLRMVPWWLFENGVLKKGCVMST